MSMRQTSLFSFLKKGEQSKPMGRSSNADEEDIVPDTPENKSTSKDHQALKTRPSVSKLSKSKKQVQSRYDGLNYSPFDQTATTSAPPPDSCSPFDSNAMIIDLSTDDILQETPLSAAKTKRSPQIISPKAKRRRLLQEVRQHNAKSKEKQETTLRRREAMKLNDGESQVLKALLGEMSNRQEKKTPKPKKTVQKQCKIPKANDAAMDAILSDLLEENRIDNEEAVVASDTKEAVIGMENNEELATTSKGSRNGVENYQEKGRIEEGHTGMLKDEVNLKHDEGEAGTSSVNIFSEQRNPKPEESKERNNNLEIIDKDFVVVPETQEIEDDPDFKLSESMCEMFDDSFSSEQAMRDDVPSFLRGHVVSVAPSREHTTITVHDSKTSTVRDVELRGFWTESTVKKGDIVHIIDAVKDSHLELDNDRGFLVVNPDWLVSGTTVVSGMRCLRNTVLQQRHVSIGPGNRAMTLGSLVHAVFQEMIRRPNHELTSDVCRSVATKILESGRMLESLYLLRVKSAEVMEDFEVYADQVVRWIKKHRQSSASMRLEKIIDIEESIWSPWYGIKGNIDLTVEVRKSDNSRRVMPLELKSGRTTFSTEHTGQVILYTMLLQHSLRACTASPDPVDAGWLVYLKDGASKEVRSDSNLQRGLLQLRNDLVSSLRQTVRKNGDSHELQELPPVINDRKWCERCPQLLTCGLYARHSGEAESLPPGHSLSPVFDTVLGHLKREDVECFTRWTLMVLLEAEADSPAESVMSAIHDATEKKRDCIVGASLEKNELQRDGSEYHLTFKIKKQFENVYATGDFVIVSSSDGRFVGLCYGSVVSVTENKFTISSERSLMANDIITGYRIDRYSSQKIQQLALANISSLMRDDPLCQRLRNFLIYRQEPQLEGTLSKSVIVRIRPLMKSLNQCQRTAILRVLMAKDYIVIRGYPGSGKSTVIATLIRVATLLGQRVLLVSHTHSAVDNVLLKLQQHSNDILRLGKSNRVHKDLQKFVLDADDCKDVLDYEKFVENKSVFGATCLTASTHPALMHLTFDLVIVDEAGQVTIPTALGPLLRLSPLGRFVLVGDSAQLPPTVRSSSAAQLGLDRSLLEDLEKHAGPGLTSLQLQYRMNGSILRLCNGLAYNGEVKCATEELENESIRTALPDINWDLLNICYEEEWERRVSSIDVEDSVIFLNSEKREWKSEKDERGSHFNSNEVLLIGKIINLFTKDLRIPAKDVGVISPYRAQVGRIRSLPDIHPNVEVNTIDQYQGRDKLVIVLSLVRTCDTSCKEMTYLIDEDNDPTRRSNDILNDIRRINVAVSRGKVKCVLVGYIPLLMKYSPFRKVLDILNDSQIITL